MNFEEPWIQGHLPLQKRSQKATKKMGHFEEPGICIYNQYNILQICNCFIIIYKQKEMVV